MADILVNVRLLPDFKVRKKSFSNIAITGMAQNRNPLPIPKGCPREATVPYFK